MKAEQLNKRLAYAMGADKSGWDLTQLLRPPGTRNCRYESRPAVQVISIDEGRAYDPDELDRILPPLPDEKAERPTVRVKRSNTPIGDRDQRALARMRAGNRGTEIQMLENGGSKFSKPDGSPDRNRDDLSTFAAYAFWLDKDPVRMARAAEASGRVRPKWYERHSADGSTYLEMTIAQAIAGCNQSFRDVAGYDAGDDPPQIKIAPKQPAPRTDVTRTCPCDHAICPEIAERDQTIRNLTAWVERLAGHVENLQEVNSVQQTKLKEALELRALDRRAELAKQRIRRAWKPGQADTIIAVATIAPPIANAHQTDEPIITREMVAETNGAHPGTAGANLKVFDLEGSPIKRVPKTLGTKSLTAYRLGGLNAAEILERMADLGESLDKAPATRAKRVRCRTCPEGTGATLNLICDGCGALLDERRVPAPPADNVSETRALDPTPAPVDVLVTSGQRINRVGEGGAAETDELAARRAQAAAAIPLGRDVDRWKRLPTAEPDRREPASRIQFHHDRARSPEAPPPRPPRCDCGCYEFRALDGGTYRCQKCRAVYGPPLAAVAGVEE